MLKSKKYSVLIALCTIFSSCIVADMQSEQPDTSAIKPHCSAMVDPQGNPLEQLLDYYYEHGDADYRNYDFWLSTPDRRVPVIFLRKENGKLISIEFEIPHRIDMDEKYSDQIDEAVKTRPELPFAAYHFVRTLPHNKNIDIKLDTEMLYNIRLTNAGKYGDLLCYDKAKDFDRDCRCVTLEEFKEIIDYVTKPIQK